MVRSLVHDPILLARVSEPAVKEDWVIAQDLLGELHVQLSSRMVDEALSPLEEMRFHYSMSAVVGAIEWWLRNDRPLSSKAMARELSHLHSGWRGDLQA